MICDHNSTVIQVICGPLGVCNSIKTEVVGLPKGLRELHKLGLNECLVEGEWL